MPVPIVTNSVAMATVLLTLKRAKKPRGEAGWFIKKPLHEAHPMGALVLSASTPSSELKLICLKYCFQHYFKQIDLSSEEGVDAETSGYTEATGSKGKTDTYCREFSSVYNADWNPAASSFINCVRGCPDITGSVADGVTTDVPNTTPGKAPFKPGDTVTFSCDEGYVLVGYKTLTFMLRYVISWVILLLLVDYTNSACDESFNEERNGVKFVIEGEEKSKLEDYTGKSVTVKCAKSHEFEVFILSGKVWKCVWRARGGEFFSACYTLKYTISMRKANVRAIEWWASVHLPKNLPPWPTVTRCFSAGCKDITSSVRWATTTAVPNPVSGQPPFGPGDVVSFTCKDGFKLEGSASVTCKGDTVWSTGLPTCQYTDAAGAATADDKKKKRDLISSMYMMHKLLPVARYFRYLSPSAPLGEVYIVW
eukprot:sb/3464991/